MKITIRRIINLTLCLSFSVMIGMGLLMAYRVAPASRNSKGLDALGWGYEDWGDPRAFVANVFFALATLNLLIVWAWLIRCAARGDFLRLAAGLLAGAVIISILILLTPSYCSRSP